VEKLTLKYIGYSLIIPIIIILFLLTLFLIGYRINLTPSMPIGIWKIKDESQKFQIGDIALFCLPIDTAIGKIVLEIGLLEKGSCPGNIEPLLKPIAAMKGDVFTLTKESVIINGINLTNTKTHATDKLGLPLPSYPRGSYQVKEDEIWLISNLHERSLDSRYFGPVKKTHIKAIMEPIWIWYFQ
jgi:conjugative transfer signal peptidase TraF